MDREQEAIDIIKEVVLPHANSKHSSDKIEYRIFKTEDSLGKKISGGLIGGQVVYIAPVNKETNETVVDVNMLTQLGITGGSEEFQDHILTAFHELKDSQKAEEYITENTEEVEASFMKETEASDLFNVTAGQACAQVKLEPFLSNI